MRLPRVVLLLAALLIANACAAPTAVRAQAKVDSVCTTVWKSSGNHYGQCARVPTDTVVAIAPAPAPAPTPVATTAPSGVSLTPFKRDSFARLGWSVVADRDLATVRPCTADSTYTCAARLAGWEDRGVRDTVVSDRPGGAGHVGVVTFPAGLYGGGSPGQMSKVYGVTLYRRAYAAMLIKLDPQWYGNPVVNKQGYVWPAGVGKTMLVLIGGGTGALEYRVYLQNIVVKAGETYQGVTLSHDDTALNLINNVHGCAYQRGAWAWLEMASDAGTPGGRNATVDWWLNGVQCGHASGLPLVSATERATWSEFQDDPIYGGTAVTIPARQYRWTARLIWLGAN